MSYQRVIDALQENGLRWKDVDRILLNEETYEEFQERASQRAQANYETKVAPAVRRTEGQEKVVYVGQNGLEVTIEI